ncbi:phospholipase A [Acinetobacter ursingii]|uniref:phospholipase A n=1 Tax=Acinetobacter ursingii TaxID=108980 RepID=UPI00244A75F1|nr:phospholipase A [Acinetobacter ursingii]MDH2103791.1 phospholipase A [Acinetobacter ursingii]
MLSILCTEAGYAYQPASASACVALESNAERLNCYDGLFSVKLSDVTVASVLVAEGAGSAEAMPLQTLKRPSSRDNKQGNPNHFFALEHHQSDLKASLIDQRWELTPEQKLGTWNLRAYQPIYLLPAIWTSEKNELPSSPNPNNTVTDNQNLKSIEAKLQLSLKTKALENVFGDNGDVWIGYTQSARWQVYNEDESRPFRETNYEPEISLVFKTDYNILGLDGNLLGLTFNHQSNGRSDPLSRSWNRAILNIGLETENFAMLFRPWYRLDEDGKKDNNPDIKNYIGRADLTTFYRKNNHDFTIMLRHSLKGGVDSHGAIQFDWAFPIAGKLRGYLQVFDGYGESLIDYNHRATYVGFGLSLMNWY